MDFFTGPIACILYLYYFSAAILLNVQASLSILWIHLHFVELDNSLIQCDIAVMKQEQEQQ